MVCCKFCTGSCTWPPFMANLARWDFKLWQKSVLSNISSYPTKKIPHKSLQTLWAPTSSFWPFRPVWLCLLHHKIRNHKSLFYVSFHVLFVPENNKSSKMVLFDTFEKKTLVLVLTFFNEKQLFFDKVEFLQVETDTR